MKCVIWFTQRTIFSSFGASFGGKMYIFLEGKLYVDPVLLAIHYSVFNVGAKLGNIIFCDLFNLITFFSYQLALFCECFLA